MESYYMRLAAALGREALGTTAENPPAGCVVVKDGAVVGYGATGLGGRPHAETIALAVAGRRAEGADVYVTLEPCCHTGRTPPCTDALVAAGVKRVVVGALDPDKRVSGGGAARLRAAGIAVEIASGGPDDALSGFLRRQTEGLPDVTLKLAVTLDGHVATSSGDSKWITGEASRRFAHRLRAEHDAILVGASTVRADDPLLTCRLPGAEGRSPVRVVLDGAGTAVKEDSALARSPETPVRIVTAEGATAPAWMRERPHIRLLPCKTDGNGRIDLAGCCRLLAEEGINRVLVEGGASVFSGFLEAGLWRRIYWYVAPVLSGGGIKAGGPPPVPAMGEAARFPPERCLPFYPDVCLVFNKTV